MKRIVEEIFENGRRRYVVETNRIMGFIPCGWRTDTFYDAERDMHFEAVFDSLREALVHLGVQDKPVKRTVVYP